ncbi:circadian-associated transcriptional repressor-like [Polypterus senegalus]|nr:circadian-associated transcriptional repressor-like [Polypterus senegalus]
MESSRSTSSLGSRDSLGSLDSFLYSDGDSAEEDVDVFLPSNKEVSPKEDSLTAAPIQGEARTVRPRLTDGAKPQASPLRLSYLWRQREDKLTEMGCREKGKDKIYSSTSHVSSSGCGLKRPWKLEEKHMHSAGAKHCCTEGDLLFTQKCKELQGFIRPLLELLNGIKTGRYDKGLSSFQQSVAMDRIQRIVGVLQKPAMGERYLGILLQVEMMLKLWFPHISTIPTSKTEEGQQCTPSKQPRIISSKFKSTEVTSSIQTPSYQHGSMIRTRERNRTANAMERHYLPHHTCQWSALSLTWVHVRPICTPPQLQSALGHSGGTPRTPHALNQGASINTSSLEATQDSSVSSTTPFHDPAYLVKETTLPATIINGSGPARCQSVPLVVEAVGTSKRTLAECQNLSVSLPMLLPPSSILGSNLLHCHKRDLTVHPVLQTQHRTDES